jgi:hypothetical protein
VEEGVQRGREGRVVWDWESRKGCSRGVRIRGIAMLWVLSLFFNSLPALRVCRVLRHFTNGCAQDSPAPSASSTPIAAQAPTPLSTSFPKGEGASNHPTPTSTTSGGAGTGKGGKKNKKAAVAAGDDSETDSNPKEAKKARTNFGAVRK